MTSVTRIRLHILFVIRDLYNHVRQCTNLQQKKSRAFVLASVCQIGKDWRNG